MYFNLVLLSFFIDRIKNIFHVNFKLYLFPKWWVEEDTNSVNCCHTPVINTKNLLIWVVRCKASQHTGYGNCPGTAIFFS